VSESTSTKRSRRLWDRFRSKVYRDAFVESHLSTNIAAQIYSIREARGWTQEQLADAAHMAQARISVMEDPSYRRFTLTTLKRLASAFDVALIVRFVPFSELLEWSTSLTPERLAVPNYGSDMLSSPVFCAQVSSGSEEIFRIGATASSDYGAATPIRIESNRNSPIRVAA
jgi:transcriptional regulator with XRE-family HTH domain